MAHCSCHLCSNTSPELHSSALLNQIEAYDLVDFVIFSDNFEYNVITHSLTHSLINPFIHYFCFRDGLYLATRWLGQQSSSTQSFCTFLYSLCYTRWHTHHHVKEIWLQSVTRSECLMCVFFVCEFVRNMSVFSAPNSKFGSLSPQLPLSRVFHLTSQLL